MPKMEARQLGKLFTDIVGTTVRSATAMKPTEARIMIDLCKDIIMTPSIERTINL